MRGVAALLVLFAFIALAATTSCWVHRKSDDLACNTTGDCRNGGTCENGYCLGGTSNGCPAPCTSCDLGHLTCEVDCAQGQLCGALHCPAGFQCTIKCSAGACGDIDCAAAQSCDIECQGAGACHNINCGPGACSISCSAQACSAVDCMASCACDVSCPNPNTCPIMSCPTVFGTGALCTRQGIPGARCDSSQSDCDTCP
jgi:hypothetical protein